MDQEKLEPFRDLLSNPQKSDYEQVLELLLEEIFAERGCMWLERENAFIYRGDEEIRKNFPFSRQAVDEVLEAGRSFISFDTEQDDRVGPCSSLAVNKVRSCLCAAATDEDGNVLVLAYFDNSMSAGQFSKEDLEFLQGVLSLVPGALPTLAW